MHKGIIIYLSIFIGLALFIAGSYFTIDNIIEPSGLLFEGIIGMSMGITLLMIIVVATTIGKTIMLFNEILEQTTELNRQISSRLPSTLPSLLKNMIPPGDRMTITNLDTGETETTPINPSDTSDSIKRINEIIMGAMGMGETKYPENYEDSELLKVKKLRTELAIAIKEENFEDADKISKKIKQIINPDSDSSDQGEK